MEHNILITSAGRRVSLVRIFRNELQKKYPGSKIITVDSNPVFSAACKVAEVSEQVPAAYEKEYVQTLLHLCEKYSAGMIIPTIDTELQVLAEHKNMFSENGIACIISEPQFITVCRNKKNVLEFFAGKEIPTPKQYSKNDLSFPVIVKPISGSASKNIFIGHRKEDLPAKVFESDEFIFLAYLDPQQFSEFTVDLYYAKDHILKCAVPRKRLEIREGEVSKAMTVKNEILPYLFERLWHIDGAQGVINLQLFYDHSNGTLLASEINPRFGGGYPLSYYAGANFPAMLIDEYYLGKTFTYAENWKENILMLRYDEEIFFEKNK